MTRAQSKHLLSGDEILKALRRRKQEMNIQKCKDNLINLQV